MSGICGIFNLDQAPAAESELRAMTAMLERRGPEGTGIWHDGPAGLGHTLLATTPELQFETQPFRHAETGVLITADVRLDNRDELADALGLRDRLAKTGDAELILLSYLTWGENCLDHFLGDFAFVIWDPRQQMLFCARDHFGMRMFYYHHSPGKGFLCASDARAILVLPRVPYQINEGRIADFLVPELEWIDYTSTFYEGVFRLPPGHKAVVSTSMLKVTQYYKPSPGPALGKMSDDDYAAGFLEVFTASVDARLRAPQGKVGSMLSGGMDSGSVVAVAKDISKSRNAGPLATFSGVRNPAIDKTDCAESHAIYAAMSMTAISPTAVYPEVKASDLDALMCGNEEPFDATMMMLKRIYQAANKAGLSVVLDGAAGDIVLNHGSYIVRLLRQGRVKRAINEISAEGKFWLSDSTMTDILRNLRAAYVPEAIKSPLRKLLRHRARARSLHESIIAASFARDVNIATRFERLADTFTYERGFDSATEICNAIWPNVMAGRERYARAASASTIEARDPFLDRRVVEYSSRLPGHMLLRNGWPKWILRELMTGKLPDEVRWCRGKPHLGSVFNTMLTRQMLEQGILDISDIQKALQDYVDPDALSREWQIFRQDADADIVSDGINSAAVLTVWLQENRERPVVPQ